MAIPDDISFPITCKVCGHEIKETVGRIKTNPVVICVCGNQIRVNLDTKELDAQVAGLQAKIRDLSKQR